MRFQYISSHKQFFQQGGSFNTENYEGTIYFDIACMRFHILATISSSVNKVAVLTQKTDGTISFDIACMRSQILAAINSSFNKTAHPMLSTFVTSGVIRTTSESIKETS